MRSLSKYILALSFWSLLPETVLSQHDGVNERIVLRAVDWQLEELLDTVDHQSAFHFSYDAERVPARARVRLTGEMTVERILQHLKTTLGMEYIVQGNVIILRFPRKDKSPNTAIRGVVTDGETGEALPGAETRLVGTTEGTLSNHYGFYSLSLAEEKPVSIMVRFLGYVPVIAEIDPAHTSTFNVALQPDAVLLQGVTVTADSAGRKDIVHHAGSYTVTAHKIKETMTFAGEPDALKTLQFLPGVQAGNEGTTNLSVRGGSYDQNLFLLDEAPVYNPSHALSFFSIFNPDALQSITLHKSSIPVSHGGRLSSVVDVRMKEGNRLKKSYSGSVGTIASRMTFEGPWSATNNKLSYMVSGRYSYAGHVVNGIYLFGAHIFSDPTANNSTTDNQIGFYDFNTKINYRPNDRDHFYFSVYSGHDNFYFNHITSGYSLSWGNKTATLRWNRVHSSKLFSNTTAIYTDYRNHYRILDNTQYFLWSSRFREVDLKRDYDYYPANGHHITFGGGAQLHLIEPGTVAPRVERAVTRTYSLEDQQPISAYLYAGNEQSIGRFRIVYGLRYSNFILRGPRTVYTFEQGADHPSDSVTLSPGQIEKVYHRVDPRAMIVFTAGQHSVTASYDRTNQYFHLLANSSIGLPTDIWMPSGSNIGPQRADIYALTYQHDWKRADASVGGFYKSTRNVLDFKDNANLFVNRYVESQLLQGKGESYGLEFFVQKHAGNFKGSVSYTLSKAVNRIAGVNQGREFPSRYDKRHNVSATGNLVLSPRWLASFNFVYTTGGALTVPAGNFTFDNVVFNYYTDRNNFRLPDYHRFDISFRYSPRRNEHRAFKSFWSFDIYNLYRRKNPFTLYAIQGDYGFASTEVKAFHLFGLVPSLSYNFSF